MDDFSRSLAAAALIDGQQFTLPGYGTLTGTYVSARINHAERHIEPPTLDLEWSSRVDERVQTFEELLIATGATSYEAADIQDSWLNALRDGETIYLGDLGALQLDQATQLVGFTPHQTGLDQAYWASGVVEIEPLSKRTATVEQPVAPAVEVDLHMSTNAAVEPLHVAHRAKTQRGWLVPFAAAASVLLVAGLLWFLVSDREPADDPSVRGQVVAVNQERLNRSPRELAAAETVIEPDVDDNFVAGGVAEVEDDVTNNYDYAADDASQEYTASGSDLIPPAEPAGAEMSDPSFAPDAFDPAALAGTDTEEYDFAVEPIEAVIVLGSFGSPTNAARMTEQIAAAGLLPYVDQQGELTRVGVSFEATSESDIADMMQRMRADFNPRAWLLE